MKNTIIKKVIKIKDIPKTKRENGNEITTSLIEAINSLKKGEAAELNQEQYKPATLVWHLNRLRQDGIVSKSVRIVVRRNFETQTKTAYLIIIEKN